MKGEIRRRIQNKTATRTYETVDTSVDNRDLDLSGKGLVLTLFYGRQFEYFLQSKKTFKNLLRSSVRRAPRDRRKRVEASRSEPN
jgi:hypothetical protein